MPRLFTLVLFLAGTLCVSGRTDEYSGTFQEVIAGIGKIISNLPFIGSFISQVDINPDIATEQGIVGFYRKYINEAETIGQLTVTNGYDYKIYYVTTVDGYILQLYYIFDPKITNGSIFNEPVLMIHGLLASGSQWIFNGEQSLAFSFASLNKSVFLMNVRGTTYSTNHTTLDTSIGSEFWDFSFDDFGTKDLPAVVEFIKKLTNYEKITVIGHSQGTITTLIYLATCPECAKNFDLVFLVSPIGYLGNLGGLASIVPDTMITNSILNLIKAPFPPAIGELDSLLVAICTVAPPVCNEVINFVSGYDTPQNPVDNVVNYASEIDRTSFKNGVHYLQSLNYDHVRWFDNGAAKNLEVYGTALPPEIPYGKIESDTIILIEGISDLLATRGNTLKLANSLQYEPLVYHTVTWPTTGHFEIVTGRQEFIYFNEPILGIYNEWSTNARGLNRRPGNSSTNSTSTAST